MNRATRWRIAFLGLTALVLGMELWAGFDGDDQTDPWTDMIVRWVPAELTIALIGALILWLPAHFAIRYIRKRKESESHE